MQNSFSNIGVKEILQNLTDDEIMTLVSTVTQQLLKNKLNSRLEAEEAIIFHSADLKSILRRKCITKEILFKYASSSRIPLTTPITKLELIDKILHFWNTNEAESSDTLQQHSETSIPCSQNTDTTCITTYTTLSATDEISAMATQFTDWFYSQMNAACPIGAEHFWDDAVLKLNLRSGTNCANQEVLNNTTELTELLFKTKMEHSLYLNPNCSSEGVQGKMDPHGLMIVKVCGTLHQNNLCIGIFDQMFGLARDPFSENNWKIKYTYLNLVSKDNVNNIPRLSECNFNSNMVQ